MTKCKRCGSKERYRSNCRPCKTMRRRQENRNRKPAPTKPRVPNFEVIENNKLRRALRNRLRKAIKTGARAGSAVQDLGCSILELRCYLENKFCSGMSWTNWGAWHIDHIIPLSSFDLTDREQFLRACHYTNLQPLWAVDNLKKHNKI